MEKLLTLIFLIGIVNSELRNLEPHNLMSHSPNDLKREHCESLDLDLVECEIELDPYFSDHISHTYLDPNVLSAEIYQNGKLVLNDKYTGLRNELTKLNNFTKIYFLIHGLNSLPSDLYSVRDSLFETDNSSYILILPNYNIYVNGTVKYFGFIRHLGEHVEMIMDYLINPINKDNKDINLYGHSLGGETVGVLGKRIYEKYNKKPKLTVGLDVAGPVFTVLKDEWKFTKESGEKTVFVHTSPILGIIQKSAIIDIYVNKIQSTYKECDYSFAFICNHNMAITFFSEFIKAKLISVYDIYKNIEIKIDPNDFLINGSDSSYRTYKENGFLDNTYKANFIE